MAGGVSHSNLVRLNESSDDDREPGTFSIRTWERSTVILTQRDSKDEDAIFSRLRALNCVIVSLGGDAG